MPAMGASSYTAGQQPVASRARALPPPQLSAALIKMLTDEVQAQGRLSDGSYERLEDLGYTRQEVDQYITAQAGQAAAPAPSSGAASRPVMGQPVVPHAVFSSPQLSAHQPQPLYDVASDRMAAIYNVEHLDGQRPSAQPIYDQASSQPPASNDAYQQPIYEQAYQAQAALSGSQAARPGSQAIPAQFQPQASKTAPLGSAPRTPMLNGDMAFDEPSAPAEQPDKRSLLPHLTRRLEGGSNVDPPSRMAPPKAVRLDFGSFMEGGTKLASAQERDREQRGVSLS